MPSTPAMIERPWQRRDLRVPREDGGLLAVPLLDGAPQVALENHDALTHSLVNVQGRTLQQIRDWSRIEILSAARSYTRELNDETSVDAEAGFIVAAGHQPTLFHPGVWVKNFGLGRLADETGGVGVNLIVDNDTFSTSRIRVPAGDRSRPVVETVPFDVERAVQPWEGAEITDAEMFASFGDRVADAMRHWGVDPLAGEIWSDAVAHFQRSPRLADCLTAVRHRLERRWEVGNLELPISRMCELDPFLWFASHLLAQLPGFRKVHNEVLAEFREVNGVRSRTHPVPELTETGGWHEAPFWVWREGDVRRKRLYARQADREVVLSDGTDEFARLPLSPEMDACCAVEALRELPARGIRIRTRALTTTLFARLCFCDLFIHGIGGSKYDEMTDRIIARFFNLPPPGFLTLSATVHLPLAEPYDVADADETRLNTILRDLEYNPDRRLPPDAGAEADNLTAEKQRLIDEQHAAEAEAIELTRRERERRSRANHARFRRLREINRRLTPFIEEKKRIVSTELQATRRRLDANAVLKNREWSFCLYPESTLRPFMVRRI